MYHSNIIVDQQYNVLGVIDWEGACTLPWELVEFPLFLETLPVRMDAPWNYDQNGEPLDKERKLRWQERDEYLQMVARADTKLSQTLGSRKAQNLAYALRAYLNPGKLAFYTEVLDEFSKTVQDD